MRALELDFRREGRQARWAGIALLAAGLAGTAAVFTQYDRLAEEFAQAQASVRQSGAAARRQTAAVRPAGDLQKVALEMKRASEVAFALKLPWNDLFASVEAANTPNVALLSIESDTGKRQVKITAEAKDPESMLDYLRFLGAQPKLANVYLQSHQVQQQDPQRPVRFVLGADWVSGQ
ncbi:MAG: PilN domain-containing protein [Betaproteobacteria bacterium]|nr:PilN domain-containing protein [Betaproteobacteria bacterium]